MLAVAFVLVACGPEINLPSAAVDPGAEVPGSLQGLRLTTVAVGALELDVAVAETAGQRATGLTGVDDLGALGGLLFVFPNAVETRFTMRDVPIALDIAFIDADGMVLAVVPMSVCEEDPCPSYASPGPYRWAVETPAGGLAGVVPGDRLAIRP